MPLSRSVLTVPGSTPSMLAKARTLPSDAVVLDLEDAVVPAGKAAARGHVVDALLQPGWDGKSRLVRVNDLSTRWTYRDVIEVVEGAGRELDAIVLPKVEAAAHVHWLDLLLSQIEATMGFEPGRIGIHAQVESARGVQQVQAIATASPRLRALAFGPGDFAADLGWPSPFVGAEPFYGAFDGVLQTLRLAATAAGLLALDGPFQRYGDLDGFRARATRSAQLGFDGSWVIHPSQLDVAHEVFTPTQQAYEQAEAVLAKVAEGHGVAMLGDVMVDEASRKLALKTAERGRAAGLTVAGPPVVGLTTAGPTVAG